MTEKLDDDFTSIRDLLSFRDKEGDKEGEGEVELPMFKDDPDVDEYDKLMRQMIFEPRAMPTNALRTEEQMALAERERLEQLERARLKRMNQEPEEHEGEQSEEDAPAPVKANKRVSADDLGEEDYTNILPAADEDSEANDVNSDEDEGAQNEDEAMSDEGSENAGTSLLEQRGLSTLPPLSSLLNKHNKYSQVTELDATAEIPFTIGMPPSFKEFNQLMKNQSVVRQYTIIKRLRTCYHVSLVPENKEVMKVPLIVLLVGAFLSINNLISTSTAI